MCVTRRGRGRSKGWLAFCDDSFAHSVFEHGRWAGVVQGFQSVAMLVVEITELMALMLFY